MASQPLPKTNLFGNYPKKSMNAYLFEVTEKGQEDQQRLLEKLEDATSQKEELHAQVGALQAEIEALQVRCREYEQRAAHFSDDLVAKETAIFTIKQKNADLQEIIERQKAEIAERDELLASKDAEIEQLLLEQSREQLPPEPAEEIPPQPSANALVEELEQERLELERQSRELEDKGRALDEKRREIEVAAQQISRIFASAQSDAENLLENARRQAGSITEDAQLKSRAMLEQAQRSADQAVSGVFQKFESFKAEFAHVQKSVEEAALSMSASLGSVSGAIADVKTDLPVPETPPPAPAPRLEGEAPSALTNEILNQYGLSADRKEFFR